MFMKVALKGKLINMVRTDFTQLRNGSDLLKRGFARMQQGGVIMDVVDPEQAAVAEDAGAVAVMALERVPA
jgi:pyridoxal 5'-phosphate synthase pdxS subunit